MQAVLTVDLGAVVANWRMLRARHAPGAVAAVVKADAYGLGAAPVAQALAAAEQQRRPGRVRPGGDRRDQQAGQRRLRRALVRQGGPGLVQDHDGGDDDQRAFEHGRQVFRLGMAVGMVGIGRHGGEADRQQRCRGGRDVHHALQRIGQQGDAAGEPPGPELEDQHAAGDRDAARRDADGPAGGHGQPARSGAGAGRDAGKRRGLPDEARRSCPARARLGNPRTAPRRIRAISTAGPPVPQGGAAPTRPDQRQCPGTHRPRRLRWPGTQTGR